MSEFCHCSKFSFDAATLVPAPRNWQAIRAWRCNLCGKIHHAHQERQVPVRAPLRATAPLSSSGKRSGLWFQTWSTAEHGVKVETLEYTPYARKIPMSHDEPLLFALWELLQSKLPPIMDEDPDPWPSPDKQVAKNRAKYEARGIAEALAILMKPFMDDADHVVKCAVKYYKDNTFEVPGLALYLWDPNFNFDGSPRVDIAKPKSKPVAAPKKTTPAKPKVDSKSTKTLTKEEADGIKEALSSGIFGKEDVASMFGVSLETLESALSS